MTAVMFPPLPYGDVGRLVYITTPNRNFEQVPPDVFIPDNADFADFEAGEPFPLRNDTVRSEKLQAEWDRGIPRRGRS